MDDYIKLRGKYSEADAIDGVRAVATALKHLHDHNMVHLDLKPKNIMRRTDGKLYLIDFGLSKQYDQNGNPDSSSTIGLGTPGYAPLEQSNYKGGFAPTLDIYALGATFYKMLTGVTPPEATDIFNDGFDSLKNTMQSIGVGSATIAIVEKAMQFKKLDRYQTVDEFLAALPKLTSEIIETQLDEDDEETSFEGYVPYAVLENETLTFYYGKDKPEGAYDVEKIVDSTVKEFPWLREKEWTSESNQIKTVVFDQSFKYYKPTSCIFWFVFCKKLTKVVGMRDYLNTSDVTDMRCMFKDCENLTALDVSGFKTDNVTDMRNMFESCKRLTTLNVSGFMTDNVTDMSCMFFRCENITSLDVSGFKTDNVADMSGMFGGCRKLTALDVSGFKTDNVTSMNFMFNGCENLISIDVSSFNTDNVTEMRSMFYGCTNLTTLDVSGFKTDNVTDMDDMFARCSSLTRLDVSGFKTDNVTNLRAMFAGCNSLTSLDVSGFKTDKVTEMYCMFAECENLTSLDVSSFKTNNVTDMFGMFTCCSNLVTIYAGDGWNINNVNESEGMFSGCASLVGGRGTKYDVVQDDKSRARIDGGSSFPGYFTKKGTQVDTRAQASSYSNDATIIEENREGCVPYAVFENGTLTFYYGKDKPEGAYGMRDSNYNEWSFVLEQIETVVFDQSFKNFKPTSCAYWFYG